MKLCSVHVVPNKQISLSKIRSYLSLFINPHTVKNITLQRHKSHQTVWAVLTTLFKLPSSHRLASSYINELLIERNSSYNNTCMVNTLLVFPELNRPNMVCTPFATLPANIGICSQRYLDLHNHYMFSNQKLRALALIINAAPFVISFNYH